MEIFKGVQAQREMSMKEQTKMTKNYFPLVAQHKCCVYKIKGWLGLVKYIESYTLFFNFLYLGYKKFKK